MDIVFLSASSAFRVVRHSFQQSSLCGKFLHSHKIAIRSTIVPSKTPEFDQVTLFLFSFIELVGEVLISSCSMIVLRYFDWHGSRAGLILASLGGLVLPAHFIVEHASRRFPERVILRSSIFFVLCSIFAICNFEGLILDIAGAILNSEDTKHNKELKKLKKEVNEAMVQEEFP